MRFFVVKLIIFFLLLAAPHLAHAATLTTTDSLDCKNRFARINWEKSDTARFVFSDGIMVTGEEHYPLKVVLNGLGLGEHELEELRGKQVLSVGEGMSGLLPYLKSRGIPAKGLDLWYGQAEFPENEMGRKMRDYVSAHRESLVAGNALNLPFGSNSMDEVVSHMLVNNLSTEQNKAFLLEALRVVKPGGHVRSAGYGIHKIGKVLDWLKEEIGSRAMIDLTSSRSEWEVNGSPISERTYLLTLTKSR